MMPFEGTKDVVRISVITIASAPTEQPVVAMRVPCTYRVVTATTPEYVTSSDSGESVGTSPTPRDVGSCFDADGVVAVAAVDAIVMSACPDLVTSGSAPDGVVTGMTVDQVAPTTAVDEVVATSALDLVLTAEAAHHVRSVGPLDELVRVSGPRHRAGPATPIFLAPDTRGRHQRGDGD